MPEGAGRLFDGKAGDAVSYDAVQRINLTVDRERDDAGIANREARTLRNLIGLHRLRTHFARYHIATIGCDNLNPAGPSAQTEFHLVEHRCGSGRLSGSSGRRLRRRG